jgi:hypothetical protein
MERIMMPRRHETHEMGRSNNARRFVSCASCFRGYIWIGILLVPALLSAQTGAAFLKIPVGPRVCGMGEAAVAYIDDASALYYNPAGLANVPSFDVLLAHSQGFLDMNQEYVAGVFGSEGLGKFGLALDYWGSGSIQGINIRGESIPGYTFSAADWFLNLGYARSFSDLSVGLGLELVHDQEESLSTSAIAFNAGAMYKTPLKGLKAGVSVANIGTKAKLDSEAYALPMQARLGWRYDISIVGVTQDFILSGTEKPGIAAGIECRPVEVLAVRLGYRTGSDYDGFSGLRAGLGINWHGIGVDYAFAPYGKLGASHRISISYRGAAAAEESEEE